MRTFSNDCRGSMMIEAAITVPVFILLLLGMIEIALMFFGNALINNMVNQLARQSMVGCVNHMNKNNSECQDSSVVDIKRMRQTIESRSAGLIKACDMAKFRFNAAPIDSGFDPLMLDQINGVDLGQGNEIVVFRVQYDWPVFTPFIENTILLQNLVNFESITIVRNEAFAYNLPNRQVDGSC